MLALIDTFGLSFQPEWLACRDGVSFSTDNSCHELVILHETSMLQVVHHNAKKTLSVVMSPLRYRSLSSWLKERFSEPVRKITIDAGLGCPNRDGTIGVGGCIFCNSRGSGTGAGIRGLSVTDQIDQGMEFFSRRYKTRKFIAYFQSFTNTYGAPKLLERFYYSATQRPEIVGLSIGTRPDCVPDDVMDILSDINRDKPVWLELGLQSIHDRTLKLIRRGHESGIFFKTADRALKRDLLVAAHIILGLPGETIEDMALTAKAVANSGIQGIKVHPLYVIAGTILEDMFRNEKYIPMTMEQAIQCAIDVWRSYQRTW